MKVWKLQHLCIFINIFIHKSYICIGRYFETKYGHSFIVPVGDCVRLNSKKKFSLSKKYRLLAIPILNYYFYFQVRYVRVFKCKREKCYSPLFSIHHFGKGFIMFCSLNCYNHSKSTKTTTTHLPVSYTHLTLPTIYSV